MKIIKNGILVFDDHCEKLDLVIEEDKIFRIDKDIEVSPADEVYDANGCYVFPGFIDGHTHFDMSTATATTADDFKSGTMAAISGGTTTVVDFATQEKGETLKQAYQNWRSKADHKSSSNYRFHMAITDFSESVKKEMFELVKDGVTSYKMYMTYPALMASENDILECLETVKEIGGVLGVHCEDNEIIEKCTKELVDAKAFSPSSHPKSRPDDAEASAINILTGISKIVDYPVNVVHLSSKKGLEEIRNAREQGIKVNVETCPQYLILDDSKYELENFESAKFVISPPLRKKDDNQALIEAIQADEIDTIATDHCSFYFKDKKQGLNDFRKIPNGAPGVEHRVKLIYTTLVDPKLITVNEMTKLMASNPAKQYGMYPKKGVLQVGSDADIVIFDPSIKRVIHASNQYQKVDYTPYENMEVKGLIKYTFVNGKCVVKDEKVILEDQGSYVY